MVYSSERYPLAQSLTKLCLRFCVRTGTFLIPQFAGPITLPCQGLILACVPLELKKLGWAALETILQGWRLFIENHVQDFTYL